MLCLVPPEWSDLSTLIRVRLLLPLLAYRGLGAAVVVPMKDGLGAVRLPNQNEIAARRVHQIYIPGLALVGANAMTIEQNWTIDPNTNAGFLYL